VLAGIADAFLQDQLVVRGVHLPTSEIQGGEMGVVMDKGYYEGIAEMLDALPERVVRFGVPDLEISYCNRAWAAGHNCTPAEVIGRTLTEFLSASERVGVASQLARLGPDNRLLADDAPRAAPNAPGQWVEWVDQYLSGRMAPKCWRWVATSPDATSLN
jgi:PAS domain-containing protein